MGDARHSALASERSPCEVGHVLVPRDRGTKETGNRGLADLILFKKVCLGFVLGRLPFNLGFSEGSWLSLARAHLADYDSHDLAPVIWTSACTGPQLLYV